MQLVVGGGEARKADLDRLNSLQIFQVRGMSAGLSIFMVRINGGVNLPRLRKKEKAGTLPSFILKVDPILWKET